MYFFYPKSGKLLYRIWQNRQNRQNRQDRQNEQIGQNEWGGHFSPEAVLHSGIRRLYSVFFIENVLHVFGQDVQGNVLLFVYREGQWSHRSVLQASGDVLFTPMAAGKGMSFVCNAHTDPENPSLIKQSMDDNGKWLPPEVIDHFKPFGYLPYEAQATAPTHMLLFYQANTDDCQIGYREITPTRTGVFRRFFNGHGRLVDYSFLTTHDALHLLMIIKDPFSCQLLYRKKTETDFTPSVLLWESPKISQCLLSWVRGEIHATCMTGGKLQRAISTNGGDSFAEIKQYKRKFCVDPVKANFISTDESEKSWFARQVYVDSEAPWDVQMIPDLCTDFYPA